MRVALGIGGGVAAYKAAELARLLQQQGHSVQALMTRAAQQFITPLTLSALTNRKVVTDLFTQASGEEALRSAVEHIAIAEENDVLVVAPATADLLARFTYGLADDFLTTTYLAFHKPVVLAPAMNTNMWNHPATQTNLRLLRERGHHIVEPESGELACGMVGPGRLAGLPAIADAVQKAGLQPQDLQGETVLLTAGPTQEPLDPVRFISNRSSGKMGYALADAAATRGARVILVSGPVQLPPPPHVELVSVQTAREMHTAVMARLPEATIIIKSAAVADYHVSNVPRQKVKKTAARYSLELDPTPDILADVGRHKGDRLLIGFAAETENLVLEARRKLESKHADMIVANLVGGPDSAFEANDNQVTLVIRNGDTIPLPRASKRVVADQILDQALRLRLR